MNQPEEARPAMQSNPKVEFDPKFEIGDMVYLDAATERRPGKVTGYIVQPGSVLYLVTWGHDHQETRHYDFELTTEYVPDYTSGE